MLFLDALLQNHPAWMRRTGTVKPSEGSCERSRRNPLTTQHHRLMQARSCWKSKNVQDMREIPFEDSRIKNVGMTCGAGRSEMTSDRRSWTALLHCSEEQKSNRWCGNKVSRCLRTGAEWCLSAALIHPTLSCVSRSQRWRGHCITPWSYVLFLNYHY